VRRAVGEVVVEKGLIRFGERLAGLEANGDALLLGQAMDGLEPVHVGLGDLDQPLDRTMAPGPTRGVESGREDSGLSGEERVDAAGGVRGDPKEGRATAGGGGVRHGPLPESVLHTVVCDSTLDCWNPVGLGMARWGPVDRGAYAAAEPQRAQARISHGVFVVPLGFEVRDLTGISLPEHYGLVNSPMSSGWPGSRRALRRVPAHEASGRRRRVAPVGARARPAFP
jgi:hypothetical protein